ncbi:hypothetical protein DM860_014188 [Cuscuta australis]|uniref:SGNH hydrolase-type esterase domain-containing protein n=1 Tax=Cuscuta australis TaxID=267555 RepID=A0A328DD35_9ASTE|nr:hypothetical protein DM860_014188 [Cuscuta australis]
MKWLLVLLPCMTCCCCYYSFILVMGYSVAALGGGVAAEGRRRAFLVFGDSLVDNGNNNYLATTARADSPPYGIDHPTHLPTGRFSNGLSIPDFISEKLGTEPILPYLNPELDGEKLLVGANFASAGVGILDDTGIQFRLYNLGARTVIVTGTGPLGCAPAEMAQHSIDADCASELQRAASLYNPQLVQMVEAINNDIGYDVFVAANAHKMHMDFITSPQTFGFVTSRVACCGQGPYNGLGFCTPLSNLCSNREEYAFWDAFHPSEKANRIIVDQMMVGSNDYMHPINLSTMLTMVLPSLD